MVLMTAIFYQYNKKTTTGIDHVLPLIDLLTQIGEH